MLLALVHTKNNNDFRANQTKVAEKSHFSQICEKIPRRHRMKTEVNCGVGKLAAMKHYGLNLYVYKQHHFMFQNEVA